MAARKTNNAKSTTGKSPKQRRGLRGKGPTPKASDRPYHVAAKRKSFKKSPSKIGQARPDRERPDRPTSGKPRTFKPKFDRPKSGKGRSDRSRATHVDTIAGRNTVVEALRAGIPAKELVVAIGLDIDERITEIISIAKRTGLSVREITRFEVESLTGIANHQGVALVVKPYQYSSQKEIFARATSPALFIGVDGVTDPRNIGAIVRSAAAFGADGVLIPERRNASITASAWKASAGAAARIPIAQVTNLVRSIADAKEFGCFVIGLDGESEERIADLKIADQNLYVIVGSEGKGLSRLVREKCDIILSIPMRDSVESLNASVAMSIALYTIDGKRG